MMIVGFAVHHRGVMQQAKQVLCIRRAIDRPAIRVRYVFTSRAGVQYGGIAGDAA
ncbi:hypothetical protein NIE79_004771 [Micromonospora sp. NIE79]|uniref:Uncharacterized protein n=1 Tax=Micromonospora trifolii TaxID=2911208 RepID=A0ABS9N921_9ACTN|nr:hypothetical protein [Micromonospora trifolii]MCG5446203.1 hypothetical protein [Micromonospora trifolii]